MRELVASQSLHPPGYRRFMSEVRLCLHAFHITRSMRSIIAYRLRTRVVRTQAVNVNTVHYSDLVIDLA